MLCFWMNLFPKQPLNSIHSSTVLDLFFKLSFKSTNLVVFYLDLNYVTMETNVSLKGKKNIQKCEARAYALENGFQCDKYSVLQLMG